MDEGMSGKHDITEGATKGAADEATAKTEDSGSHASPFNMRKRISSTTYEVSVYFSQASRETMDDKILRLARGEAFNEDNGH